MKNIIAINGSPKVKDSASANIIGRLAKITGMPVTGYQAVKLLGQADVLETIKKILEADTILVVFPLYVDALPAPLVRVLSLLEQANAAKIAANAATARIKVYAVCNCGFFEPANTMPAFDIIENFCVSAKMKWCGGAGLGGGGFVASQNPNIEKGPAAGIHAMLHSFGKLIAEGEKTENVFAAPKIPRFVYSLGGNLGWRQMAKKNKTGRSLGARPYEKAPDTIN